jgi:hypothetical protein
MDAESPTRPDRTTVIAAHTDIATSSEEVKDELLTELLVLSYPVRAAQDN